MDERTKRAMLDAPAGPSAPAPLPPAPPLGPAAWAGVGGFTTGHGVPVSPPSAAALQASAALIAAAAADAAAAPPGEALLPTGANWDVLQVVTSDGLVPHLVQPEAAGGVEHRDPSTRVAGGKRSRAGEE